MRVKIPIIWFLVILSSIIVNRFFDSFPFLFNSIKIRFTIWCPILSQRWCFRRPRWVNRSGFIRSSWLQNLDIVISFEAADAASLSADTARPALQIRRYRIDFIPDKFTAIVAQNLNCTWQSIQIVVGMQSNWQHRNTSFSILVYDFLGRNSSRDRYKKEETRFFLTCITYKVNFLRVSETRNPETRILPYH